MSAVYIPWANHAVRHPFADRFYRFSAQTRLIDVIQHFARYGATVRWNIQTRRLEVIR